MKKLTITTLTQNAFLSILFIAHYAWLNYIGAFIIFLYILFSLKLLYDGYKTFMEMEEKPVHYRREILNHPDEWEDMTFWDDKVNFIARYISIVIMYLCMYHSGFYSLAFLGMIVFHACTAILIAISEIVAPIYKEALNQHD